MKKYLLLAFISIISLPKSWGGPEKFSDAEANFKLAMQKILTNYIDKNVSVDDLYRAATEGMLNSLNQEGEKELNELLSPSAMQEMQIELSGKVTGIGVEMKFDQETGYAQVLRVIAGSVAAKAGLKAGDQILSVNGKKFKQRPFSDLVATVRGETGKSVGLKILREDKLLSFNLKREIVAWTPVHLEYINNSIALLSIGLFNQETPKLVKKALEEINHKKLTKLIVDLRGNSGGAFIQAVEVAEFFLPPNAVIVTTKNREGEGEEFRVKKSLLSNQVQLLLLVDGETSSGAELFTSALKENKKVKIVGQKTYGKWNAQIIESLANNYFIKYTVKKFESPQGHSYQGVGIRPDLEIELPVDDKKLTTIGARSTLPMAKRLELDHQLKAGLELIQNI